MHFEVQYIYKRTNWLRIFIWRATSLLTPNYIFFLNFSALHILVMLGHADVVKFMTDPGRLNDVNPALPFGLPNMSTPLGIARENGDEDIFRIIRLSIIRHQRWKKMLQKKYLYLFLSSLLYLFTYSSVSNRILFTFIKCQLYFLHILQFQITYYLLTLKYQSPKLN